VQGLPHIAPAGLLHLRLRQALRQGVPSFLLPKVTVGFADNHIRLR
jgi:hypothetical protein